MLGHAELRQGRAGPGRRTSATACSGARFRERPGRGGQVMRAEHRPDAGGDAGARGDGPGGRPRRPAPPRPRSSCWPDDSALTRFANSEIHQNVAETTSASTCASCWARRVGRRLRPGGPTPTACAALAERCGAHRPASSRSSRTGRACRSRRRPRTCRRRAFAAATADASPELRADGCPGGHRRGRRGGQSSPSGRSPPARRRSPSPTRRASARPRRAPLAQPADGHDGPRRRHGLRGGGRRGCHGRSTRPRSAARRPRRLARSARTRSPSHAGEYPVVLEEYAVVDVLDMLGYLGFSGLAVEEERSFFEPGRRIGSDLVTIVRRRRATRPGMPVAFDYEGVANAPRRRWSRRGVCRGRGPRRRDRGSGPARRSTGHGLPAPNPYGPFPLHMVDGRRATPSREELVGGLRPRPARDPLPLHERGPSEARDRSPG